MVFEFDPSKSAANKAKHGIDFEEGQAIWVDPNRIGPAPGQTKDSEARWLIVGQALGRLWLACYTERGDSIRIITIRPARVEEKAAYEEGMESP